MSIALSELAKRLKPEKTVLFFGAGSSCPSGAPSANEIIEKFSNEFNINSEDYLLGEISSLVERKHSRKEMVMFLRDLFKEKEPTGSILNLPLYNWKNIYTTNYDTLIEQSYKKKNKNISVIASNFDFSNQVAPDAIKLFKLHGSIEKDEVDSSPSRLIITDDDYDLSHEYKEILYNTLENDITNNNLVIIGHSLSDPHIKKIIHKAININQKSHTGATINLLLFKSDENRALLQEKHGIEVAFGGLDDFFIEIDKFCTTTSSIYTPTGEPLDYSPSLRPVTIDISHEIKSSTKDASAMFNGWPASYADIAGNLTFRRTLSSNIIKKIDDDKLICIILLGASGMGKTTLAKQVMYQKSQNNFYCWEHKLHRELLPKDWREVAKKLKEKNENGVLLVDDAHGYIYEVNSLVDFLIYDDNYNLKLILTSTRNQWNPRVKTPNIYHFGEHFHLKKLDETEIDDLLTLVDSNIDLRPLVENSFSGFSRIEGKRRLTTNCKSDTFVCLKNIFASEKFDDIILREFATLESSYGDIYRHVAAMESSGINVHRQLIVRLLGIPAQSISASLDNLLDIIHEYTIDKKEGIYGWKGRHPVITDIIAKYKMVDLDKYYNLFEKVINHIVPTHEVEIRTIRQLCSHEKGIKRFPDKHVRNKLLRKMISKLPGERIPRHRLIRNLIDINEIEKAETEIRLFENDFKADGPINRYKIILLLARAERTLGLLDEDRLVILENARSHAVYAVEKYKNNKDILSAYCDVGIEFIKRKKDYSVFDDAMDKLKETENRIGDPDITNIITRYTRQLHIWER